METAPVPGTLTELSERYDRVGDEITKAGDPAGRLRRPRKQLGGGHAPSGVGSRRAGAGARRFHRTLLEEWAYQRPYTSDAERQAAFPDWLDWYNYPRPHTGISGHTPASRVTNLSGQHT